MTPFLKKPAQAFIIAKGQEVDVFRRNIQITRPA
jgi:hypothetical protein